MSAVLTATGTMSAACAGAYPIYHLVSPEFQSGALGQHLCHLSYFRASHQQQGYDAAGSRKKEMHKIAFLKKDRIFIKENLGFVRTPSIIL